MSSVLPLVPSVAHDAPTPFFWIQSVDERGNPVDERYTAAAYQKVADFRRYRRMDLRDDAVRAELVEKAVYVASRAEKSEPVRDVSGYLFCTFMRLVDAYVERENKVELHETAKIDRFVSGAASDVAAMELAVARREVFDAMDEETRWAYTRRLYGYEVQEIAAELNITPDCLSTRLRRGMREAAGKLMRRGRMSDNNLAHGRRESTE